MKLKMIALDLDDTLLNPEKNIAPSDAQAVRNAIAAGYYVTLATGRMYRSALPYANELGIINPLVVYNGALLRDPLSHKDLGAWPLPREIAQPVIDDCLSRGIYIQAYVNDTLWTKADCEEVQYYSKFARVPYEVKGEEIHHLPEDPHKLLIVAREPGQTDLLRQELTEKYAGKIKIVSSSKGFLEITAPATNKWNALRTLAQKEGIKDQEILCIGDSDNDLEMIKHCGIGCAMGNASDAVREAATGITGPNTRQGVSWIIRAVMTKQLDVPEE